MNLRERLADGVHFDGARVLRSLGLTLIGWVCGALVGGMGILFPYVFGFMAPYVLGGWLFVILPHVLLVPRGHLLSHPLIAPIYGALLGLGILCVGENLWPFQSYQGAGWSGDALTNPLILATAAITGAVIGLAGSLSHRDFRS
jgi:hypothetical protein